MPASRTHWRWPPQRRDIVAVGSGLLFAVGLIIIGFGLAKSNLAFTALGLLALAVPIIRWFRIQRGPEGTWTFEGAMEKPPDSVSESETADERSRRHSG